jgi:hypothetical protein
MRILFAAVLMLFMQLGASAQFAEPLKNPELGELRRDQTVMQGLMTIVTAKPDIRTAQAGNKLDYAPTASRGGNGSPFHPNLGCYIGSSGDFEFKSGYKDLDAKTMAAWAYDLHEHVANAGGGWENYQKYSSEQQRSNELGSLQNMMGTGPPDAMDRSKVAYKDLYKWSQVYWDHWNQKFRKTPSMFRDWFTNDAIIDGMNIYMEYQFRIAGQNSADFVMFKDVTLAQLMRKE